MTSTSAASGPTAAISGLVSGMDTASIIDQLMTLNAAPQTALKSKVTTEQSAVSALQGLNSKIAAIATKASALGSPAGWNPVTTSSSSDTVSIAATAGASTGSVTFSVNSLASAYGLRFTNTAAMTDRVTGAAGTSVTVTTASGSKTIDSGDGSLRGLVNAINASGTDLKASTIRLDDGTYRLRIDSATTGAASAFSITDSDGNALLGGNTVASVGADAEISVGGDLLHSSTNTFTGLISGVNVTLSSATPVGSPVTVSSDRDIASISTSVQDLVDSLNASIDNLNTLTGFDPVSGKSGTLAGESAARSLSTSLRNALYPTDGTSMAGVGIQLGSDGHFTFDAAAFTAAYQADPDATAAKFTTATGTGFADRVNKVTTAASDSTDGTLTQSVNSHNSAIKQLNDSIADWDIRLDMQRSTLTAQFTAMETAMSTMQSQSSWLTGQINSLPTMNSSK